MVAERSHSTVDLGPLLTDDALAIDAFLGDLLDRASGEFHGDEQAGRPGPPSAEHGRRHGVGVRRACWSTK